MKVVEATQILLSMLILLSKLFASCNHFCSGKIIIVGLLAYWYNWQLAQYVGVDYFDSLTFYSGGYSQLALFFVLLVWTITQLQVSRYSPSFTASVLEIQELDDNHVTKSHHESVYKKMFIASYKDLPDLIKVPEIFAMTDRKQALAKFLLYKIPKSNEVEVPVLSCVQFFCDN